MTRLTFGAWLRDQTGRQDAVGNLAQDYVAPCSCRHCKGRTSRRYSVGGVREEMRRHDAIPSMYEALETAAAEWRKANGTGATRARDL